MLEELRPSNYSFPAVRKGTWRGLYVFIVRRHIDPVLTLAIRLVERWLILIILFSVNFFLKKSFFLVKYFLKMFQEVFIWILAKSWSLWPIWEWGLLLLLPLDTSIKRSLEPKVWYRSLLTPRYREYSNILTETIDL